MGQALTKGEGPFPVLVFNHGSTGHGTDPDDFVTHELYHPVSDFFVKRNWMVIIPHRRGRGDSDGKYDEGLDGNGYSSNFEVSMLGVDRAITDLSAAMEIIMSRKEVDKTNIIIGGHSRGGLLSIAFSGNNSVVVKGVISFVGGWYAEGASTSFQINSEIALKGWI